MHKYLTEMFIEKEILISGCQGCGEQKLTAAIYQSSPDSITQYAVTCKSCGFTTPKVVSEREAIKIWNYVQSSLRRA